LLPEIPASSASNSRQFAGFRPDWEMARAASAAAKKSLNYTEAEERWTGRS
jgi:hypothetical protein